MDFFSIMDGLSSGTDTLTGVMKWINDNLLSKAGGLSGIVVRIVNMIKDLLNGEGAVIDFFKGLFT